VIQTKSQRSPASFSWFTKELRLISPDLRLVWGAEDHGLELWVIQRRIPPDIHAVCLADFHRSNPGLDRYFDQQLTDDRGTIIGSRHFDRVPEWALGHIVCDREFDYDDPRAYREPAAYDLQAIRRWLFEYKNVEEQIRENRAIQAKQEEFKKSEMRAARREGWKIHPSVFGETPRQFDFGKNTYKQKRSRNGVRVQRSKRSDPPA